MDKDANSMLSSECVAGISEEDESDEIERNRIASTPPMSLDLL